MLLVRFEGEYGIDKEVSWVASYFKRIYGNPFRWLWFHVEIHRESFFVFIIPILASENFVDWLGLIKCFKDFQNVRNLEIMFFVCKLEPNWFKWRRLQFKCLIVMFLLSRISVFKYIRWLVNCLTVSATLPLSDFSVGAEIIISASGKFSWIKYFNWGNLFKI